MQVNSRLKQEASELYAACGPSKPMRPIPTRFDRPKFFIHRRFLGEQDLLVIFMTRRCRYRCNFCDLPMDSSQSSVGKSEITEQFRYVLHEVRHSLGVLDRVTLSNDGSVFDASTFDRESLFEIVAATSELKRVRTLVFETRLEFVDLATMSAIREFNTRAGVEVLAGFETHDADVRDRILGKRESLADFIRGLDVVAEGRAALTAYVLFKPDPSMTDADAMNEAEISIEFLREECRSRSVPLTVRLNPMYAAGNSAWAANATHVSYLPPRLSDVLTLAQRKRDEGLRVYIGLASEGLDAPDSSFRAREDFTHELLKRAISFNAIGLRA
jgi:archaeosine synthase beta-subunit